MHHLHAANINPLRPNTRLMLCSLALRMQSAKAACVVLLEHQPFREAKRQSSGSQGVLLVQPGSALLQ